MKTNTSMTLALCASLALLGGCAATEDATESVGDTVEDVSNDGIWDQVEGNWSQLSGSAKERWGELTDDEVTETEGNYDQLVGKIQEKYGVVKSEAEAQVDEWAASLGN